LVAVMIIGPAVPPGGRIGILLSTPAKRRTILRPTNLGRRSAPSQRLTLIGSLTADNFASDAR
jgi:hypothetical protein